MLENLKTSLFLFQEEMDLDDHQRYDLLQGNITGGFLDLANLKIELKEADSDERFDWVSLACDTSLLINPADYEGYEVKNHIKMWLWDYLFPEVSMRDDQIRQMRKDVADVLLPYKKNEGWMLSYDGYNVLKRNPTYQYFEYYNLWKLDFCDSDIERRPTY